MLLGPAKWQVSVLLQMPSPGKQNVRLATIAYFLLGFENFRQVMDQTGKRGRIESRGDVGSQRAHNVEGLGGLPLLGLIDAAHGKLADVKYALGG